VTVCGRVNTISVCNQPARSTQPSICGTVNEYQLLGIIKINGDGRCCFWQPVLQADSQPKSSGLVLGRRPLGAILHSSNEPGELSQWLCHDESTINIVVIIIIIIIKAPLETASAPLRIGSFHLFVCPFVANKKRDFLRR